MKRGVLRSGDGVYLPAHQGTAPGRDDYCRRADGRNMDFLRGAVDGGLTGDMLSVHKYIKTVEEFNAVYDTVYDARGYVGDMPVIVTETSVLSETSSAEHWQLQADYVVFLRDLQWWKGVPLILWYSMANYWWYNNALVWTAIRHQRIWSGQGERRTNVS